MTIILDHGRYSFCLVELSPESMPLHGLYQYKKKISMHKLLLSAMKSLLGRHVSGSNCAC